MKTLKHARYFDWPLMLLLVTFLFGSNLSIFAGQGKTPLPSIVNTVWKGPIINFETSMGPATAQAFFLFERDGKVTESAIAVLLSQIQATPNLYNPMYNPSPWIYQEGADPRAYNSPYRYSLTMTPGITRTAEEVGKYKLVGGTLYIEFASSTVVANLDGEEMTGASTNKKTNEKKVWKIQRIPDSVLRRQVESPSSGASNKASNSTSDNTPSPFSLSEFQNSYFKPFPLTQNTISGTNPDGSLNHNYYSFIVGSGELTFTLVLKASQDSFASQVSIEVQDRKNNVLASKFVTTSRGRTDQAVASVNIPEKQAVLLKVNVSGGASYQIRLNGAIDFGQATLSSAHPTKNISKPSGTGDDAIAASQQLLRGTLVSNGDGTLRPANGYQWVNPKDPKDLRVQPIP